MKLSVPVAVRRFYPANNSLPNLLSLVLTSWFHVNSMLGIAIALLK
jgi:hypothetical protein